MSGTLRGLLAGGAAGLGLGGASAAGGASLLGDAGELLATPRKALWSAAGLPESGGDLMEQLGVAKGGAMNPILGTLAEMLGDPLTWGPGVIGGAMGLGSDFKKAGQLAGLGTQALGEEANASKLLAALREAHLSESMDRMLTHGELNPTTTVYEPGPAMTSLHDPGPTPLGHTSLPNEYEVPNLSRQDLGKIAGINVPEGPPPEPTIGETPIKHDAIDHAGRWSRDEIKDFPWLKHLPLEPEANALSLEDISDLGAGPKAGASMADMIAAANDPRSVGLRYDPALEAALPGKMFNRKQMLSSEWAKLLNDNTLRPARAGAGFEAGSGGLSLGDYLREIGLGGTNPEGGVMMSGPGKASAVPGVSVSGGRVMPDQAIYEGNQKVGGLLDNPLIYQTEHTTPWPTAAEASPGLAGSPVARMQLPDAIRAAEEQMRLMASRAGQVRNTVGQQGALMRALMKLRGAPPGIMG